MVVEDSLEPFVVRPAVLLSILIASLGGLATASRGDSGGSGRAPVAVRAPLSAGVLQTMARRRLPADAAVAEYWTAGRMREADQVSARAGHVPAPGTGGIAGRTVGKVFFTNAANGRDYSCSAAVVRSPSKSLVSTAGHCVYDSQGTWHQNWIFVPFFDRGRRPYGIWPATWLATFTGWAAEKRSGFDVAFVKVTDADGRSLVDVVGGNELRVGLSSRTRELTILGYPFLPPYPGDRQYSCQGVTRPAGRRLRMACPLTTGASGGPWLEGYDAATGEGYIDGVTTNTDLANTTLWSPYFDDEVGALYRWADRL